MSNNVIIKDGIGYGVTTKAAFYTDAVTDKKKFTTGKPGPELLSSEWSLWGDNNMEPIYIADDIKHCGVLSAAVQTESRLAMGRGIDAYLLMDKDVDGTEHLEWVSDAEINDFLEANDSFLHGYLNHYNMLGYGWGATQLMLNGARNRINRIKATDIAMARLQKKDTSGNINNMYLCGDWSLAPTQADGDKVKTVPLLIEGYEHDQLVQSKSGYEFAMLHRILINGHNYYPQPLHRSAKAWVDITRSVPSIKNAINKNQMTVKYLIIVSETYFKRVHRKWDSYSPEKRQEIIDTKYNEVNEFLMGEEKSGKSIMAGRYYDVLSQSMVDDITITVLDDKMKDGKMLPDSAAADKQILFSMFFNPAIWGGNLLGDGASGGAGSGSDIREATLVLLMLLNPERQNNLKVYNLIKRFNGWDTRLQTPRQIFPLSGTGAARTITPRLVFRYSSSVLTTLDTGGSTKPLTI